LRIDIVTVFPEMVAAALDYSIVKRARERGLVAINVVNLRDFTTDRHKTTDDMPYGGGGGMVMKIEPIARALDALTGAEDGRETAQAPADVVEGGAREEPGVAESVAHSVPSARQDAVNVSALPRTPRPRVLLTDPRGQRFTQELARQWAREPHIVLLCGHYEGVDERVRRHLVTDEVSIGDYILTGGELPALVIVDALTRLQPDALGDEDAPAKDSFAENLLEYPHYTRPRVFRGWAVPEILFSGHHAQIERWRRWHQLRATQERRPDLFARLRLAPQDEKLLAAEEPTAPPDKKRTAPKTAEPQEVGGSALEPVEETKEREEADGTGTGNDT
jgi:tRNA (guanine37-N1)-methyltransferase